MDKANRCYVIRAKNEKDDYGGPLYWNNQDGWGDYDSASVYSNTDWNLPIGGEWHKADTISFDADGAGNLVIEIGAMRYEFSAEEEQALLDYILDGRCPFCMCEIPMDSRVCCSCLVEIARYHQYHDACVRLEQ
jgi:hypothetical protein